MIDSSSAPGSDPGLARRVPDPEPVSPSRRATRAGDGGRGGGRVGRRWVTPWLFLTVPLAFLVTFTYVPVVNLVQYSLTNWDGFSAQKTFVGLHNYVQLFTQPQLFEVFFVSLYYLAGSVVQLVLALFFATILSFNTRFRGLFKGILFFPSLINGVAIGFIFLYFFQPDGVLDATLKAFGSGGQHLWLGNPAIANWSLASVSVWRYMGMNFVLFLGAIQSIPAEIYEASDLDGANRWHQFRYIILPGIRPIVGLTAILAVSGSLSVFEIPFIMTRGASDTQTFVIQTVKQAFEFNRVGLASAAAVVLLVIVLLVTWIQRLALPDDKADLV